MKCLRCNRAALYQEPGFNGKETCWCTLRNTWREKGCRHFRKGKPRRAVPDVFVIIDGVAAVNGYHD